MLHEGIVTNGVIVPPAGLTLPEGAWVRFEIVDDDGPELDGHEYPDLTVPDDHPDAPYNRERELEILRASIAEMKAGERGIPLDEAMARIAAELQLPAMKRE